MIRISQIVEGSWSTDSASMKKGLLVEGALSGDWVEVLEKCWLEALHAANCATGRVDLSGVTYIDEKGRELLARMVRAGAELTATGVMTRAVIDEIAEKVAMARNGQTSDRA